MKHIIKYILLLCVLCDITVVLQASPTTCTRGPRAIITPVNQECMQFEGPDGVPTEYCTSTDITGASGPIPGYYIVDGITYAQTRAGVQAAIDAASAAGGGVVLLTSDITIDSTSLFMKANVVLDGQAGRRFRIKAPATAQSISVITNSGLGSGLTVPLEVNATRGTMNITVPSSVVGDYVRPAGQVAFINFIGCMIDDLPDTVTGAIYATHKVCGVDTVTSTVILCWPLLYDCRTDLSATVQMVYSTVINAGIRHLTIDANGNTGTGTRLLYTNFWVDGFWEDIVYDGDWSKAVGGSFGVVANAWHGGSVDNIRTGPTFKQYLETRDLSFRFLEATSISNVRSSNTGGFGPNIHFGHNVVMRNFYSNRQSARGFRIDSSSNVNVLGMHSCGQMTSRGSGMWFAFGSHQNTVMGHNSIGNQAYSMSEYTTGDNNNVMLGMQSLSTFGSGDIGPNDDRHGTMVMASKMNADFQYSSPTHMIQGSRFNSGQSTFSLNDPGLPRAADMQFNGALSFSFINESYVGMNVRTRAGVMKRVLLSMTPY
jgi:hypothetical protein